MLPQFPPPPAIYNSADELYHNAQTFVKFPRLCISKKENSRDPSGFELVEQRVLFAINLDIILVLVN
ncbi:unnamed protein product [Rhizophagus irregularis]|nr:unnamed protein product [Rhizophagus irregularis]